MNKNISEEIIEIGGVEYTLFLNRAGIISWEKMTRLQEKAKDFQKIAEGYGADEEIELTDDANPFELYADEDIDKQIDEMQDLYAKFYWVALYTHHKLTITQARELFEKAKEEYGFEQLSELANQMIETANSDILNKERKNLKALKSTKKN